MTICSSSVPSGKAKQVRSLVFKADKPTRISLTYDHTLRCSELLSSQQDAVRLYVCARRLAGKKSVC
uniref:Uncharacterized protein n=1 Tax=Rhizophagus irregularis (strain DAOM 181602 / DAOM 197198 / MUCL 43194) TaxID=747089 RepID=U9T1A1_RHIID